MNELYLLTYYGLSFGLVALMLYQGIRRTVDLLSFRNLYLAGFIFFQLLSIATAIATNNYKPMQIIDLRGALATYFIYTIVFLAVFFLSYHWLGIARWAAKLFTPKQTIVANDWLLLLLAAGFFILGLFFRFMGQSVPGLGYLIGFITALPAACALVGWVWGGRRFNFAVVAVGTFVLAASVFLSLWGVAGRRPLIEVCLGFAWGAYHRMQTKFNLVKVVMWSLPVVLLCVHLLGAFSIHRRHHATIGESIGIVRNVLTTSPVDSFGTLIKGQNDAVFALWCLDAFPDRHEPRHLFTFKYIAYHPIPRAWWPDKPLPLSKLIARLGDLEKVGVDKITLPPCAIGYAQAEGGFYALLLYALFYGQFTRFFDQVVRLNPGNPFLILPTGCALGQVLGLARGDLAVFTNLIILSFLSIWLILLFARSIIGQKVPATAWRDPTMGQPVP